MAPRHELQTLLEDLLGSRNVYFQEPENLTMKYPCIVYHVDEEKVKFADNSPYNIMTRYQVTIIDEDPDTIIREKVRLLPRCLFARRMVVSKLNHYIYSLYF